jgi:5,10-methylene-tetrahydrofolate dehydrogenase/methenyl tetrahydrofolate cyclohydrolase
MKAKVLDGKELSKKTEVYIEKEVCDLISKGIKPTLATILVGSDPASETYVKMKRNNYEYSIGTFKNSINPRTNNFTQLGNSLKLFVLGFIEFLKVPIEYS